ncbi:MAG: N-ethylammeline chlorohydrolase [Firmicutes bacterium HGW-Firmicutes-15]|nr:MAG: N-ethylammeline chlorohydrolase [Firmicutes bacterium HGW-Firmicutes-15]
MEKLLIKNGSILTMSTQEPSIFKGDILVEDNRIAQIGRDFSTDEIDTVINAEGKVVMPGLINCHNHAAMVLLRGYCDDLRLMEWLKEKIWPAEDRLNGDDIYWGTMLASAEMIKSGTTTFADMYFFMDEVAMAVQDSGIRAALCQGLLFNDDNGDKRIKATQRLFDNWRGKAAGRITTMVGPHAPYTCPPDKFKLVMELAKDLDSGIHIHLAETTEEVNQMFSEYGKSPTKYLADLGLFESHHVLIAHAVNLSRNDINILRDLKGGISHNPVSNLKLGCGIAPVKELRDLGIAVGLGTDGAGSASTLDMFEEIKAAAWLQKNRFFDPTVITAYDVLQMATIEGAKALGLDKEIGTLEQGKRADIIIMDIQKPHLYPQNDICALLAYSANGSDVDTTIINGKVLMQNRVLLSITEEEVLHKAQQIAMKILR